MPKGHINQGAVEAFELGDAAASRDAHDSNRGALKAPEAHKQEAGKYIKSIVFGGLDGIITTFAVVAGVAGADLSVEVVLVLGFANLVADGISMGFGEYLSTKAEMEYTMSERDREAWELDNYPQGEKEEMVEIYMSRGFSEEDATTVIDIMAKNKKYFVDHMMVEELGLMPPDEDDSPSKTGLATFISFLVFGFIPLVAYLFVSDSEQQTGFIVACVLTLVTLAALGVVKAKLSSRPVFMSAMGVLLNGGFAAAAAYLIGWGLGQATGIEHC